MKIFFVKIKFELASCFVDLLLGHEGITLASRAVGPFPNLLFATETDFP